MVIKNQTMSSPRINSIERMSLSGPHDHRIPSIDLLRGLVMVIMALDHVRNYFHDDAFLYNPTDLSHTNAALFFTRFITHYCAPVFVFLAGISAYQYGLKRNKVELARYLLRRGVWLVFIELFIVSLGRTFNPAYPFFNLQVIWAIAISMIMLSAFVFAKPGWLLLTAAVLISAHNLLDNMHIPGQGLSAFAWSVLHEPNTFVAGPISVYVQYPVLPWTGIIVLGYYSGRFYGPFYGPEKRRTVLLLAGSVALAAFFLLRSLNIYGDPMPWSIQQNGSFSTMSFFNVTKYPPSLHYILITLGPALIFLALTEKKMNRIAKILSVFGQVPFFYYILHIYLIHILAMIAAALAGYDLRTMILSTKVNASKALAGYGFGLPTVYMVWGGLLVLLYPLCRWFNRYKQNNREKKWLGYL
jgi:uncharacterized membrane protein